MENLNYDYEVLLDGDSAAANVIRFVGSNKKVLEIGAGPGSITKHLNDRNKCDVVALEIDDAAIKALSQHCRKVYKSDLNSNVWANDLADEGDFDVIVAADVLEHLYDPWETLKTMKSLLRQDGFIVLSLPHVAHAGVMACMASNDFAYSEWGLLDKTHIRFFGIKNIQEIIKSAELKVVNVKFVLKAPEDTEFSSKWSKLTRQQKTAFTMHDYSKVYQVVVKLALESSNYTEVQIDSASTVMPKLGTQQRMVRIARKFLSVKTLKKIKSAFKIKSGY